MGADAAGLTAEIVASRPLDGAGNSGNSIESVTLRDGRELVLKRVSPQRDWLSRLAHDRGRLAFMWESGLFERMPRTIDHTIVAVEAEGDGWNIFMRDVSGALVGSGTAFGGAETSRVLAAMHGLHTEFWGEQFTELCSLVDRYTMFSPGTAQQERQLGNHHGEIISRGWEAFAELVSQDVADAVLAIAAQPSMLAEQLGRHEATVIHGDLRLGNLGFAGERVVIIDWGERVGSAPPAVELAWFIGFDAYRMDTSPDDVVAEFRSRYADKCDEVALQLGLIGGLVQLGGIIGWWVVNERDGEQRARFLSELSWWDATVSSALETWSPT